MSGDGPGNQLNIPENIGNYIAIFTGLIWKLYDDNTDLKILPDSAPPIEALKILIIVFTMLLLLSDIYISIIFLVLTGFVFFEGVAETSFWKAGALIPILTTVAGFAIFKPTAGELAYFCSALVACIGTLLAEHKLFPEEISWKKAGTRIINAGIMFIFPYMFPQYSYSRAFLLIAYWNLGYTAAWLGVHGYLALWPRPVQ